MAEYLIQGETLSAAAAVIKERLKLEKYSIDPAVIESEGVLASGAVVQQYIEYVDCEDWIGMDNGVGEYPRFVCLAYDFAENNEGETVPVLYLDRGYGEPDYYQPCYYVGKEEVNGAVFDKWRMLQLGDPDYGYADPPHAGWESDHKLYIYTNEIVSENGIPPVDFPEKINAVWEAGYAQGLQEGNQGNQGGQSDYDEGYAVGYDKGWFIGYEAGYKAGYYAAQNNEPPPL